MFRKPKKTLLEKHLEIKGDNFFFLLISLILLLVTEPFLTTLHYGQVTFLFLFVLVFIASIYAIGKKNKATYLIALVLIIFSTITRVTQKIYPTNFIIQLSILFNIITLFFVTIVILKHIFKDRKITLNEIYAAICAYLLIGIIWGFIYFLAVHFNPNAIASSLSPTGYANSISEILYFSFITLTSTGFGDIYPVSSIVRAITYMEAIIGQIYLVVLIGWMVGTLANTRRK
jgi:voltage-gated potassium channel